jgi:pSer/pThr/pTyr-binding forkhead associated (FHA) protein
VVDPPDARGRTFPLGRDGLAEVTVGRAAGCGLALTEDTFVSQLHARLFRTDGTWQIEDLGSTNGTFLNRRKISGPQSLHVGDRVQVGRTVLEVSR